jgi:hypothetical protein
MTLLSDDGLDATYLAASLRGQVTPPNEPTEPTEPGPPHATTAERRRLKA